MFIFINHSMFIFYDIFFVIFITIYCYCYYIFLPVYLFMLLLLHVILFFFLLNLIQITFVNCSYFIDNFKLFSNIFDLNSIPSIHQSKCVFDIINDHEVIFLIFPLLCIIKLSFNYMYHFLLLYLCKCYLLHYFDLFELYIISFSSSNILSQFQSCCINCITINFFQ